MNFLRQMDILKPNIVDKVNVLIIGAGGIGSLTTITLAKMGFEKITVIDSDFVESHNIPNQFYGINQEGMSKVEALSNLVELLTGTSIRAVQKKIESEKEMKDYLGQRSIVISAIDNMEGRKTIFNACKFNFSCWTLIDCRVTYPYLLLFKVNTADAKNVKRYKESLYSDEESYEGSCTASATFYTSLQSAVYITQAVQSTVMKERFPFSLKLCFSPLDLIISKEDSI